VCAVEGPLRRNADAGCGCEEDILVRIITGIAKVAALCLAVALGTEIAARAVLSVAAPEKYRLLQRVYSARSAWTRMMQGHSELGYALRPGLDTLFPSEGREIRMRTTTFGIVDDIGFRDIGTEPPFDAIAVGGSLTLCDDVPVEGCWVRQVADSTGRSIATLGVNGYSTRAAVRMLDLYGRKFAPQLVLAEVFPNDFKDEVVFEEWKRSGTDNYWIWAAELRGRGPVARWLGANSIVYRAIDGFRRSWTRRIFSYQDDDLDFVFRFDGWWLRLARDATADPGWPLIRDSIAEFRRIAAEMDSRLLVVVTPSKEQVYWDIARRFLPESDSLDPDAPTRAVVAACRENGVAVCDLTEPLRAEARRGKQLYHQISGHWNDAGGGAAARAVHACLEELGWARP
jgi:hypothetical protein